MALELRIAGPGLDVVRRLEEGDAPLTLGRDADCGVCLPDPEHHVSRRHLEVWLKEGELNFHVTSVVNGVEMPFGEAPPGARGVVPAGQVLKLASYSLTPVPAQAAAARPDPWAVFDREDSTGATMPATLNTGAFSTPSTEDDPFGDWGFETTFGPGAPGGALDSGSLAAGGLPAFFRGLGLDMAVLGEMTEGELEAIGKVVRTMVHGILDLHGAGTVVKKGLRAEDRTMLAPRDNNPLKTDWPEETKLRYLFGGHASGVGFIPAERAMREMLAELKAHDRASMEAIRAAVRGTLSDFDPAVLKSALLVGGTRLLEGARAWSAFVKYYEQHSQDIAGWTQRQLDRHFSETYVRESLRIKRETGPQKR
jgi:type VI secretion system FHA domain protein